MGGEQLYENNEDQIAENSRNRLPTIRGATTRPETITIFKTKYILRINNKTLNFVFDSFESCCQGVNLKSNVVFISGNFFFQNTTTYLNKYG